MTDDKPKISVIIPIYNVEKYSAVLITVVKYYQNMPDVMVVSK